MSITQILNNCDILVYKNIKDYVKSLTIKILQIASLQRNHHYIIYNDNIIIGHRICCLTKIFNLYNNRNSEFYNFIKINIDYYIHISSVLITFFKDLYMQNNIEHNDNIYNSCIDIDEIVILLYNVTVMLSETIAGLNNITLNNYYNFLILDIKKIIIITCNNNLTYLNKYVKLYGNTMGLTDVNLIQIHSNLSI